MTRERDRMMARQADAADQQPFRCARCHEAVSHIRPAEGCPKFSDCACTRALRKKKPVAP